VVVRSMPCCWMRACRSRIPFGRRQVGIALIELLNEEKRMLVGIRLLCGDMKEARRCCVLRREGC